MSIISFTTSKQGVQDLIASLPAPATPPVDRPRSDDFDQDAKPGFRDLLRDSTDTNQAPKRVDSSDSADSALRETSDHDQQAVADKPDQSADDTQEADNNEDAANQPADETESEQGKEQAAADTGNAQADDTSDDADVQAALNAAAAQLNVVDAVATDQPKVEAQASNTQQIDLGQLKQGTAKEKTSSQVQSQSANLSVNAALANQAQSANGPVVEASGPAVIQPIAQQTLDAQTNSGDSGSDSKSAATTAASTTASTASSNAAATTAFTIPDQAGSEARLPINPTGTTQTSDAARQVQVQAAANTGDNDALNTARLTRGLANAVQQRGGAVTLRLTPPEMGTVRIQMQITGTNVSASFHAESASAQTLLTTQLAQLRSALESKGMSVERLSVQPLASTTASNNANQSQNQSDTQQRGQTQQQSAGDGRSRGQYSGDSSQQQSSDQQQDGGFAEQARRGFFDRLSDAAGDQAA